MLAHTYTKWQFTDEPADELATPNRVANNKLTSNLHLQQLNIQLVTTHDHKPAQPRSFPAQSAINEMICQKKNPHI